MTSPAGEGWRNRIIQSRWPWSSQPARPADVSDGLTGIMLARENFLEDVYYHKIVPNRYLVEVNAENYRRNYQSIAGQVTQQWRSRLIDELATANERFGRREYAFGGPVQVELRPADDLLAHQVRIHWQLGRSDPAPGQPGGAQTAACLEQVSDGRRWLLRATVTTIGRYDVCDIHLAQPEIQQRRLISGQHAYLNREPDGGYRLFDGSPAGKPSRNGTYVNNRRIPPEGQRLADGDQILLAAPAPEQPSPGAPGTALLVFHASCQGSQP